MIIVLFLEYGRLHVRIEHNTPVHGLIIAMDQYDFHFLLSLVIILCMYTIFVPVGTNVKYTSRYITVTEYVQS